MIIDKNYEGIKIDEQGRYLIQGNVISDEDIRFVLDSTVIVSGCIFSKRSIEARWGIKAGLGIKAGDGIKARWGIKAGDGIEAGLGIEAGWGIEAGKRIFAGISVYHSGTEDNFDDTIKCKKLISGTVCYGKLIETGDENE